ncbi:hypothetical protein ATKI12_5078 [Kitasatospora sp. Ki12]
MDTAAVRGAITAKRLALTSARVKRLHADLRGDAAELVAA